MTSWQNSNSCLAICFYSFNSQNTNWLLLFLELLTKYKLKQPPAGRCAAEGSVDLCPAIPGFSSRSGDRKNGLEPAADFSAREDMTRKALGATTPLQTLDLLWPQWKIRCFPKSSSNSRLLAARLSSECANRPEHVLNFA